MASQADWGGLFAPPQRPAGLFAPPEKLGGLFAPQLRPPDGLPSLRSHDPTLRERVGNAVYDVFNWAGLAAEQVRRDATAGMDFVPGVSEAVGADEVGRAYDAGRYLDAALGTGGLLLGMVLPPAKGLRHLPMDQASVAARMREMGYADEPFYRGEATGKLSDEYPDGGYFSRDREYARGFARRGGQEEPREFRLNLSNTFRVYSDVTAQQYADIVRAAQKVDPKFGQQMAEDLLARIQGGPEVPKGREVEYVMLLARDIPDLPVAGGGQVFQALEVSSRRPEAVLREAGYDAVDSGRDVRKLLGHGIRSKDAVFDPKAASDTNIYRGIGIVGVGLGGAGLLVDDR